MSDWGVKLMAEGDFGVSVSVIVAVTLPTPKDEPCPFRHPGARPC